MLPNCRYLQLGYESIRPFIADQKEIFRPPVSSVLPPHCTKDVYRRQGSTRDLWTVGGDCGLFNVLLRYIHRSNEKEKKHFHTLAGLQDEIKTRQTNFQNISK
jgi:hypothetical protein